MRVRFRTGLVSYWTLPVSAAQAALGQEVGCPQLWSWEPWGLGVDFLLLRRPFW